jgi:hypothetical protein
MNEPVLHARWSTAHVLCFAGQQVYRGWIGRGGPTLMACSKADLTQRDLFLWVRVKGEICRFNPGSADEREQQTEVFCTKGRKSVFIWAIA